MKKVIVIIAVLLVIIAGVLLLINVFSKNQGAEQTIPESTGQIPGNLPVGSVSEKSGTTSQVEKSTDSVIRVESPNNTDQVQDSFRSYINQNIDDYPSYATSGISSDYPVNDKNGNMVSLQSFLSSVGGDINPEIEKMVGKNYYGLFYCINEKKQKEFGIAFDAGYGESKDLRSEGQEIRESMKKWEPYMLKDLHNILFPSVKLSETDLNQSVFFQNGKFRYATLMISGDTRSINYFIETDEVASVNRIYITSSEGCLSRSLDNLFDY